MAISTRAQVAAITAKAIAKIETFLVPVRLVMAVDGTGKYRTVQEAVVAVRGFMQVPSVIFIKHEPYHEKLLLPSQKTNSISLTLSLSVHRAACGSSRQKKPVSTCSKPFLPGP